MSKLFIQSIGRLQPFLRPELLRLFPKACVARPIASIPSHDNPMYSTPHPKEVSHFGKHVAIGHFMPHAIYTEKELSSVTETHFSPVKVGLSYSDGYPFQSRFFICIGNGPCICFRMLYWYCRSGISLHFTLHDLRAGASIGLPATVR